MRKRVISFTNILGKAFFCLSIIILFSIFLIIGLLTDNSSLIFLTIIFSSLFSIFLFYFIISYFYVVKKYKGNEYILSKGLIVDSNFGLFGLASLTVEFLDVDGQTRLIKTGNYFWYNQISKYMRKEYVIGYLLSNQKENVIIIEEVGIHIEK